MSARSTRTCSRLIAAVALALLAAACSVENTMPVPDCEAGDSGILVAQSVPTGQLLPCFTTLPAGWASNSITINRNGTVVRLDSDRASSNAAVLRYTEACDIGDAVAIPSTQNGAEAFQHLDQLDSRFRAHRYYLFSGGCVQWTFDFDNDASASPAIEIDASLELVPRELLNQSISQNFVDKEV